MSDAPPRPSVWHRLASLPLVLAIGLALRALAAGAVHLFVQRRGTLCVFGDTSIYWQLAQALRTGATYQVAEQGAPHYALRAPGYPLFLAACQATFGPQNTLAVRLVQAVLGAGLAWLAYRLVGRTLGLPADRKAGWTVPMLAALLVAVEPYTAGLSVLILSEALFLPLMLLSLWGMASLWAAPGEDEPSRRRLLALGTGLAAGATILVRPSWALFVPTVLLVWVVAAGKGRRGRALRGSVLVAIGVVAIMAPWWVRNAKVHGRFVPTALWVGASLYDGLNPDATGASDMDFLQAPGVREMPEVEQDAHFRSKALAFVREHPRRAFELAAIKAARFWSPWPNAEELDAPGVAWASALVTVPLFALMLLGLWDRRRDPRALVLLAGPLFYFAVLHMVFVGSVRYRVPGAVPALGLAAIGLGRVFGAGLLRSRARRVLAWGMVLVLCILAGGIGFAYLYVTDGATLAALIEREAPRFLPGSRVVVGQVEVRPLIGEATLQQTHVHQRIDGAPFSSLQVAWFQIRLDVWALLKGKFEPREIVVAQPLLRIGRRADGTYNLQGLLADPWPAPPLVKVPRILVRNGTVQLDDGGSFAPILRDVTLTVEPGAGGPFRFEGTAKGDGFERLKLAGTYDHKAGRLVLDEGELSRFEISDTLRRRLPAEWRPAFRKVGLTAGELDVTLNRLTYDPAASPRLRYEAAIRFDSGAWNCEQLPFPLSDVSAVGSLKDGTLTLRSSEGTFGRTKVRARGALAALDPERGPLDLFVDVIDLEIDERLRAARPAALAPIWERFDPRGRAHLYLHAVRDRQGGRAGLGATVDCQDVALTVREFPYPLEHVRGRIVAERGTVEVDLAKGFGDELATCKGTILDPGDAATIALKFVVGALPLDQELFDAMSPDVLEVVQQFHPTGTVRGTATLGRTPPTPADPEGKFTFHADLDLREGCALQWDGLPYPVAKLTGRLRLAPDRWTFEDMVGWNGTARITGDGWVRRDATGAFLADIRVAARNLPFNPELKRSLPTPWQSSWDVLSPTGTTGLNAEIKVDAAGPHYKLTITPEDEARVRLRFTPTLPPGAAGPAEPLELPPMERIKGTFVFDDGPVTMADVSFQFRGSPIRFRSGRVVVQDGGKFALGVNDLTVADFRLDSGLRKLMPPVMAEFARKLDESTPLPLIRGDLALGWSGRVGEPAWCRWDKVLIVFNGQTIRTELPLQFVQGQIDRVWGRFDGKDLEAHGRIDLDSVHLMGQQITRFRSPIDVVGGQARLDDVRGAFLGGEVTGRIAVGLEATPNYSAELAVADADLGLFTQTIPGRQSFRGLLSGAITLTGRGSDMHTLNGGGQFRIAEGDLGELPFALRLFKFLKLSPATKTAFDSAEVAVRVQDGTSYLDPIRFTGDAISLLGAGTLDLQGDLDIRLRILYGRDRFHVPVVSDALREAGAQFFDIHVTGPASFPRFQSEVLPQAADMFKNFGSRSLGALRGRREGRRGGRVE